MEWQRDFEHCSCFDILELAYFGFVYTVNRFLKSGKPYELLSWSDRHPGTLFWHSIWQYYSFWHTIWKYIYIIYVIFILTFYLTFFLASILTYFLASILTFLLAFYLTFSLASGWGWGSAVPTDIWPSQLGPGSAQWDPALAVGVWLCPLTCGAHGWGPAVWRSQLRA